MFVTLTKSNYDLPKSEESEPSKEMKEKMKRKKN